MLTFTFYMLWRLMLTIDIFDIFIILDVYKKCIYLHVFCS